MEAALSIALAGHRLKELAELIDNDLKVKWRVPGRIPEDGSVIVAGSCENANRLRIREPTQKDLVRLQKYRRAWQRLRDASST